MSQVDVIMWAVVELMGRQVIAGQVSSSDILGVPLIRVDVPSVGDQAAFTKLFGGPAIYGVTPCSEEYARNAAAALRHRPIDIYIPPARQISRLGADIDEYADSDH